AGGGPPHARALAGPRARAGRRRLRARAAAPRLRAQRGARGAAAAHRRRRRGHRPGDPRRMPGRAVAPTFFTGLAPFRRWLKAHGKTAAELVVGFYTVGSGRPSITYPDARDEALCWGWIDGIRRNLDDVSYSIRFTPRKPKSIWSLVNLQRVAALTRKGACRPPARPSSRPARRRAPASTP